MPKLVSSKCQWLQFKRTTLHITKLGNREIKEIIWGNILKNVLPRIRQKEHGQLDWTRSLYSLLFCIFLNMTSQNASCEISQFIQSFKFLNWWVQVLRQINLWEDKKKNFDWTNQMESEIRHLSEKRMVLTFLASLQASLGLLAIS